MGGRFSTGEKFADNDYEMVIKTTKKMELYLEQQFGATGKGLHEKLTSADVQVLPPKVVKSIRYIATIRNRLIHDADMDEIPDRKAFIDSYTSAMEGLDTYIKSRGGVLNVNSDASTCIVS